MSLKHYGVKGMHWGVRRYHNPDGTLTPEGKKHRKSTDTVFISGSSKTEDKNSEYYRKQLPKEVKKKINEYMINGDKIVVGDAPGIDRQVQRYLKKAGYENVEIYGPGKQVRYTANKKWKTNPIDAPEFEPMSPEWLRKKDIAMTNASTKGLAIILDEGAKATRNNVKRMLEQNKQMSVFELRRKAQDSFVDEEYVRKILEELDRR